MFRKSKFTMQIIIKILKRFTHTGNRVGNVAHVPVLLEEVVSYLNVGPSKIYVDMTFGAGGHCRGILKASTYTTIFALDRDPIAYKCAQQLSDEYPGRVIPLYGRFSDLPRLLKDHNVRQKSIDGIVFDFGCSSMQFDKSDRGFSLSKNGPLDMRMNKEQEQINAADVLAKIEEHDLERILRIYGEEKASKKIARAIIESRSAFHKIETTKQLADLVLSCVLQAYKLDKMQRPAHIATKTFQAIRIFVNNELNEINYGMLIANKYLKKGGRLVAVSFHSLEDKIVKRHLNGSIVEGLASPVPLKYSGFDLMHNKEIIESLTTNSWKKLHKHVVTCSEDEISINARSRSAKLRAAEKII